MTTVSQALLSLLSLLQLPKKPKVLALGETLLRSLGEDHTLQTVQGYKAGGRDFFSEASIELLQQLVPNTSENRTCMRNQYT